MPDERLSDVGEFGLIDRITRGLPRGRAVLLGPGDDAAVIAAPDGRVVASADLLVEGRHFRLDWSSAYDVGRRAAAANLADVVAMGAQPTALLCALGARPDWPAREASALAAGLRDEAALVGAAVAGGDVVASERLVVAVTALGDLGGRAPVRRAGAVVGDDLFLVGCTGVAAAGLALLEAGERGGPLVEAHRHPNVPYELARAAAPDAHAMIDVSDGLVADAGHLATASGVAVEIDAAALDIAAVSDAAHRLGVDPLVWALTGGDDHAFVVATTADLAARGVGRRIGRVVPGPAGVHVLGGPPLPEGGWEHFR